MSRICFRIKKEGFYKCEINETWFGGVTGNDVADEEWLNAAFCMQDDVGSPREIEVKR